MYCPQCGTESNSEQRYCRSCGANLKVVAKAVTLGDAISRTDGVPAKIKEIIGNIKIAHVTDEVSKAMDNLNREISRTASEHKKKLQLRKEKTAEQRRERHLVKGTIKLFWGGGLTIFLYFLAHALVLKLPADVVGKVPFEIDPVVRIMWLIGFLPILSGIGHILASLAIRPGTKSAEIEPAPPLRIEAEPLAASAAAPRLFDEERTLVSPSSSEAPTSVTDRTTNILEHAAGRRQN